MKKLLAVLILAAGNVYSQGLIQTYPNNTTFEYSWSLAHPIFWDDFCAGTNASGAIGQLQWSSGGAGATTAYAAATGRPCNLQMTIPVNITGGFYFPYSFAYQLADVDTAIWIAAWTTGANVPDQRVGFLSGAITANPPASSSVYFEHLAADTNWFAVTRDGAAANQTRTDTNIAYAANTYFKLGITHPSSGVWNFYINDALAVSTSAGHIPAESTLVVAAFQETTYNTQLIMNVDYFWMRLRGVR